MTDQEIDDKIEEINGDINDRISGLLNDDCVSILEGVKDKVDCLLVSFGKAR